MARPRRSPHRPAPVLPDDVPKDRRKARIPDRRANIYCRGECGCQGGSRVESCDGRGKVRCDRCVGKFGRRW